jgi:alcohol dehydrogenase class IV
MLPRVALVDPELTYSLPAAVTAATGMDALTQLIEPFVSIRANLLTDAICREGLRHAARSLQQAVRRSKDVAARRDMAFASLCGGLALANAGLGAVHGFAGPLGGMVGAPHGAICAVLLPEVVAANVKALRQREPGNMALARYGELGLLLTGDAEATVDDTIAWLRALVCRVGDSPAVTLRLHSRRRACAGGKKARAASSMKANPIVLTDEELTAIVDAAC